ncbi:MAG: hypothetical protein IJ691_00875 [Lachnospiraceae bacterium]|nr:hypothetical protein [Lachnospiraceae bacterium]
MNDIIKELTDLRYLNWTKSRKSSGTAGSFLKSYDDTGTIKKYYKISDFDTTLGIVGHECVNEIIAQRLMNIIGIEHLEYKLIHALIHIGGKEYETFLCESLDYKKAGEQKITLEDFFALEKRGEETPFEFCLRNGWDDYVYKMLIVDYLLLNRDRHGANIEVLRDSKKKTVRIAPLFDHGLSLVCRCRSLKEVQEFEPLEDKRVQAFIGSSSTAENIRLVPKEYFDKLNPLKEIDKKQLLEDLEEVIDTSYLEKIWEMIWKRWCTFYDI